ncbi:MAG: hypothetical protein QOE59_1005 [Actinomycetota bacterium]|nr:hypothetical protein [Actinomycetota bacterium]
MVELDVDEVGPSLRYATAKITKTTGGSIGASAGRSGGEDAGEGYEEEPPF